MRAEHAPEKRLVAPNPWATLSVHVVATPASHTALEVGGLSVHSFMYLNCISSVAFGASGLLVSLCIVYVSPCMVMNRFLCLVPSFATVFNLYRYMRMYRLSSILDDTVSNTCVIMYHNVSIRCIGRGHSTRDARPLILPADQCS